MENQRKQIESKMIFAINNTACLKIQKQSVMKKIGFLLTFCLLLPVLVNAQTITPKAKKVQKYGVDNNVIAHRGTTFWAPELTEAAFRWARNIGADYVELETRKGKFYYKHSQDLGCKISKEFLMKRFRKAFL